MMYTTELAQALVSVLDKAVTLPKRDLSGYVANLAFWETEFAHCIMLLDGYYERFDRMKRAIAAIQQSEGVEMSDGGFYPESRMRPVAPTRRGASNSQLRSVRQKLVASMERFLNRILEVDLIDCDARQRILDLSTVRQTPTD